MDSVVVAVVVVDVDIDVAAGVAALAAVVVGDWGVKARKSSPNREQGTRGCACVCECERVV